MSAHRPSTLVSTVVIALLTLAWGYLRLYLFAETVLPLTFVLPLLACIWTGRRWQLWTMAGVFATMVIVKVLWILPESRMSPQDASLFFGSTLINIFVGAIVVHAILVSREKLEARNATITAQNAELEAQAEELSQQNEEIKAQSEELAEQNEEIEAQAEEVTRQNEDLSTLNVRLTDREEILEGLLQSTRDWESIHEALNLLCARTLSILGEPAVEVAILEQHDKSLVRLSRSASTPESLIPEVWPLQGSLAEVVLREGRTAYLSELKQRADLAQPFGENSPVHSVLATPIVQGEKTSGLLVACSCQTGHWTDEQFRIVKWAAAQGGLMMGTLQSQQALAQHAEALEKANQSKDRFLAMLSHELRTPLTPVLALAGALREDARLPEEIREDLQMVHRNVSIQSRLIDDLLDLTRISRGKVELDRKVFKAAALLRDTAVIVAGDIDAKSQRLHLDLDGIGDCSLIGDGPRLQQVFWNLLKNAIKFSPSGARIELRGTIHGPALRIEVRDSGIGVEAEDRERIFLPFEQRLNGPRRASESGLGLGLAIAKAVVEMHDGQILVHSEGSGKGSTFTVTLPIAKANQPPFSNAHQSSGESFRQEDRVVRILLVEDHADTGRTLTRLLRNAGYEVHHSETAACGLRHFGEQPFDLVISDLGLPDESGLELMRKLRAMRPTIRGICMSGYGMEDDVTASRDAGFLDHLTKPIDLDRLRSAVSKLVHPKDLSTAG
jgi:CheY-like chemotaxis protein